jgi:hypothetical protein
MSQGSGRKEAILDKCAKLRSYLASEQKTGMTPYWQDLGTIEKRTQEASESELLIVDRELAKLVNLLKERDRGDGKGIVNAERWDRFFGRDDAA